MMRDVPACLTSFPDKPDLQSTGMLLPANPGRDFLTEVEWGALARILYLTPRELTIGILMLEGGTRKGIAHRLHLSPQTIRVHIDHLFEKFRVKDRLALGLRIARIREAMAAESRAGGGATCGGWENLPHHTTV